MLESLMVLLNELENKNDPDPVEINVVSDAYQFIEKLKILETTMRRYAYREKDSLKGDQLQHLYEKQTKTGSSKLYED
jgi:DNA repair photolyase